MITRDARRSVVGYNYTGDPAELKTFPDLAVTERLNGKSISRIYVKVSILLYSVILIYAILSSSTKT